MKRYNKFTIRDLNTKERLYKNKGVDNRLT